jgi:hypothetical protein
MATITSVNNTTVGQTYNIHDPATWIGGVVPGPGDIVVLQSSTATTWYLTQNWTIQEITWTASSNRSESGIEIPSTITQNVTFTMTAGNWAGTGPMISSNTEIRSKPIFAVKNPVGTTVTVNHPGNIYPSIFTGVTGGQTETAWVLLQNAGSCYFNVTGYIYGVMWWNQTASSTTKSAIYANGVSGYTEINCSSLRAGADYGSALSNNVQGYRHFAIRAGNFTGNGKLVVNVAQAIGDLTSNLGQASWASSQYVNGAIFLSNNSLGDGDGVIFNLIGNLGYAAHSAVQYGHFRFEHTSGKARINVPTIRPGSELWTQGYNNNWTDNQVARRCLSSGTGSTSNTAEIILDADIYGPYNISNAYTSNNYSIAITGEFTVKIYGDIYSSPLNRYQIPFYFDDENSYFYHMEGTAYCSISSITWSTRVQYLGFRGGCYHANVVQSNDPTNLYAANRTPFLMPNLGPNPNYTGGNQLTWTYIKGPADRGETTIFINANYSGYNPLPANVRSGITYGNGAFTGTCAVPLPSQVQFGIPVDATVGTWTGDINNLDPGVVAASVWNYNLGNITNTTNGAGQRLLNNATIESTGEQIAALGA